ncbi:YcnI family protein [Mycobacterium sp. 236(2023)]|uniref:YcnI family copper-binding membrane protein n=1 Tax=Mycobacterium sp. 236(2023) TaxID=3038163 RepID=UPI0024158A8E|nr:YcnI family protein [Mycobacterium sp. 236(2023)]MDG4667617.1 YcnI family protein [Mycobacterium sp. 236(2023)]
MQTFNTIRSALSAAAALTFGAVIAAAPASAHVRVDEGQAPPQGGYGIVRLIVPTESADASTVGLTVNLPQGVDLATARTLPIAGWIATVETEPAGNSQRVKAITWRAVDDATGIKPAEFGEFTFSAGPWPENSGSVALLTDQKYSDGTVVSWNEIAVDANTEPEHPAPVVTLGAPEAGHSHDGHGAQDDSAAALSTDSHPHTGDVASASAESAVPESWFWRAASLASLVVALGTAGLLTVSLRRNRGAGSS